MLKVVQFILIYIIKNGHQPKMPNYVAASGSNSIFDQLTHLGAQEIYQCGGVPDSAMEFAKPLQVSK